jgi:mono/diheme cytochrome c family protein
MVGPFVCVKARSFNVALHATTLSWPSTGSSHYSSVAMGRRGLPPLAHIKTLQIFGRVMVLAAVLAMAGCGGADQEARAMTGGDPIRGRQALRSYGCYACHTIKGVPGAHGKIGPVLDRKSRRASSTGQPADVSARIQWIRDPQGIGGPTLMPNMGVSEQDARDVAAYLYTLP